MSTRNGQHGIRRLILGALVVPFLILSLLSPQVMPQRSADGALILVLCTGEGVKQIAIDPITGEPVPTDEKPGATTCDWAAAHPALTLTKPLDVALAERRSLPFEVAPAAMLLAAARATGLPPSTGPPVAI